MRIHRRSALQATIWPESPGDLTAVGSIPLADIEDVSGASSVRSLRFRPPNVIAGFDPGTGLNTVHTYVMENNGLLLEEELNEEHWAEDPEVFLARGAAIQNLTYAEIIVESEVVSGQQKGDESLSQLDIEFTFDGVALRIPLVLQKAGETASLLIPVSGERRGTFERLRLTGGTMNNLVVYLLLVSIDP